MSFDAFGLILQAGLIVKLVLMILFLFSLFSWAIIVSRWRELRGANEDSEAFLEVYHQEAFNDAYDAARELDRSPISAVFLSICDEMGRLAKQVGGRSIHDLQPSQLRAVHKHLAWATSREGQRLERGLPFLASCGSSAVYIGLFGTVIGVIQAFQGIAASGNASLAVVAPGIAEALIATAVGLVAAIPATIFYNQFAAQVDVIVNSMEHFASEFEEDLSILLRSRDAAGASLEEI